MKVKLNEAQAETVARLAEWYETGVAGVAAEPADPRIALDLSMGRLSRYEGPVRVFAYHPNPNSRAFVVEVDGCVIDDWVIEE